MDQGRYRAWWRLALLLLPLSVILVSPVAGASVTLAPRVSPPYGITIANKFGFLNVTNTQTLNSFIDFTNGTILFNVAGLERTQITYSYTARSYGNGTFDLRFQTSGLTPRLTDALASSSQYTSGNVQVIDYSGNVVNDPVILVFQGLASQQLYNAAVYASFFFGLIITCVGVLYGVTLMGRIKLGLDVISGQRSVKPAITTTQVTIIGLMVIIGFGTMIIIAVFFGNVLKGLGS